jgi:hypothetical protein
LQIILYYGILDKMCAFAKKRLRYAAMAYLACAVIGTFIFFAIDDFGFAGGPESPPVLVAADSHFDCLAISPAKNTAPHCRSLPRVITPQALIAACAGLICGAVKAASRTTPKTIKNTIILKLRI